METISKMEHLLCRSQRRTIFVCIAPVLLARPKIVLKQNVQFQHARITNLFLGNAVPTHVLQVIREKLHVEIKLFCIQGHLGCMSLFHVMVIMIDSQLFWNVLINYFSCNSIGQLFLGDPCYSSGTIKLAVRFSQFYFCLHKLPVCDFEGTWYTHLMFVLTYSVLMTLAVSWAQKSKQAFIWHI